MKQMKRRKISRWPANLTRNAGRGQSTKYVRHGGSTLVEFALVVPVLLALLIGIMEFGWLVKNNMQISNAAREGARRASLGNTNASVRAEVARRCIPMTVTTVITYSTNRTTYTVLPESAGTNVAPQGSMIRVRVRTRHQQLTGLMPFLRNRDLRASAEFGRE